MNLSLPTTLAYRYRMRDVLEVVGFWGQARLSLLLSDEPGFKC